MSTQPQGSPRGYHGPEDFPRYMCTLLHVYPGSPVHGVIVSSRPLGIVTHWYDGRSWPHERDESLCEGCARHNERRWSGHLAVQVGPDRRYGVIRYTGFSALREPRLQADSTADLRALNFTARRDGNNPNSPLLLLLHPVHASPDIVRPPVDLLAFMLKLWNRCSAEGLMIDQDPSEVDPDDVIR